MAKVLLQRAYVTTKGVFRPGDGGEPVEIPNGVIAQFGLPKSAKQVGDDYVPPKVKKQAEANETVEMTAAQMEAKIRAEAEKRADEILAARAKDKAPEPQVEDGEDMGVPEPEEGEALEDILDGSVKEAKEKLSGLTKDDLEYLLEQEKEGRNRSSMVVEIEAAIADHDAA